MRRRAEDERGPGGLEVFDARQSDPGEVAGALAMLSFETGHPLPAGGRRGRVEGRRAAPLEKALTELPAETVLVLIARGKAPQVTSSKATEKASGEVREYAAPKPWELPKWCVGHARELGLQLDQEAAKGARRPGWHEPAAPLAGSREDRARGAPVERP